MSHTWGLAVVVVAAFWAGAQNALAGGGSFLTLPALMLSGLDARAANITSTIALFPAQIVMGITGRDDMAAPPGLSVRALIVISLVGGALGALLLLATPPTFFARLVPWLVLFATAVFAWGSFIRKPAREGEGHLPTSGAALVQFAIAVYGGYFGGGIGFLMLAALTLSGLALRNAGATKNVLAAAMNASAVAIFAFSPDAHWMQAIITAIAATAGGYLGALMLKRVNDRPLRVVVVIIGALLTIGLFWTN